MPIEHRVKVGEGVSSIAFGYGRFPDTVWNDSENAELQRLRGDMNMLVPGDVVVVHDLRPKVETAPTGESTRFVLKTTPAVLRLQVSIEGEVIADRPYTLTVDGVPRKGKTDADGVLEQTVPPRAKKAVLRVEGLPDPFDVQIGRIQPIDTLPGVKARLNNLGFVCGEIDGPFDEATRAAIREFEEQSSLPATGDWENATMQQKLREIHDSSEDLPPEPEAADGSDAANPDANS